MKKHTRASQFLEGANREERRYYFIGGIRNPLDVTVTRYLKLKNNHGGNFTDPEKFAENGGFITSGQLSIFNYIQRNNASFSEYFQKFVERPPYGKRVLKSLATCDFTICYEDLQKDFSKLLEKLEIAQVRPLPLVNSTEGKKSWASYYTDEDIERAKGMYSNIMSELGYQFPESW